MFRAIAAMAGFVAVIFCGSAASAGVYTDELTKCLVSSATENDKLVLVQWLFAEVTLNPAIKTMSNVTTAQRESFNRQVVDRFERLVLKDCRKETVDALKYEGPGAIEASFSVLGQVAGRGMMSDPNVAAGMAGLSAYMDKGKWTEVSKEAGIAAPTSPPSK